MIRTSSASSPPCSSARLVGYLYRLADASPQHLRGGQRVKEGCVRFVAIAMQVLGIAELEAHSVLQLCVLQINGNNIFSKTQGVIDLLAAIAGVHSPVGEKGKKDGAFVQTAFDGDRPFGPRPDASVVPEAKAPAV